MDRPPDALEGDLVPRFITSQPPTENPTGLEAPTASANPSFSITRPPRVRREDSILDHTGEDPRLADGSLRPASHQHQQPPQPRRDARDVTPLTASTPELSDRKGLDAPPASASLITSTQQLLQQQSSPPLSPRQQHGTPRFTIKWRHPAARPQACALSPSHRTAPLRLSALVSSSLASATRFVWTR